MICPAYKFLSRQRNPMNRGLGMLAAVWVFSGFIILVLTEILYHELRYENTEATTAAQQEIIRFCWLTCTHMI